jgi:hypothetical protein
MEVSAFELVRIVYSYLEANQPRLIGELHEWIVPRLPTYFAAPTSVESQLAGLIEIVNADVQNGEADEVEARQVIREFIRDNAVLTVNVTSVPMGAATNTYSTPLTSFRGLPPRRLPAGTQP